MEFTTNLTVSRLRAVDEAAQAPQFRIVHTSLAVAHLMLATCAAAFVEAVGSVALIAKGTCCIPLRLVTARVQPLTAYRCAIRHGDRSLRYIAATAYRQQDLSMPLFPSEPSAV